jgi:TatD DNase family protein
LVEGGHYISFAGNLTHSSPTGMRLRAAARFLPLDHILVETDAPYVRPKGRFGRNEPAFILDTLAELARARSAPLREMAMVILENSKKAFNLKGLNQVQSKDCGTVTILS